MDLLHGTACSGYTRKYSKFGKQLDCNDVQLWDIYALLDNCTGIYFELDCNEVICLAALADRMSARIMR